MTAISENQQWPDLLLLAGVMIVSSIVGFTAFVVAGEASKARILGKSLDWNNTLKMGIQLGTLVASFGMLIFTLVLFAKSITNWLAETSSGHHTILTGCAITLGISLFALRKWQRILYGALEIAASIAGMVLYPVAPHAAADDLDFQTAGWVLGLLSLMYILVRGLDNVDVGRAIRRKSRLSKSGDTILITSKIPPI